MKPSDFRLIRERLGLTQARAASLVGVSRNTWNRWEMGTLGVHPLRQPRVEALMRTAEEKSRGLPCKCLV